MKIGIMTFHRAANYGAILQAYALRDAISKTGNEVEIIDYRCKFIEDYYSSSKLLLPRNWKRLAGYLINNGNLRPNKERFFSFLKDKGVVTAEQYYTTEELEVLNEDFDIFLSGSDQVWNYITAGFDKNYFLKFVKDGKKKFSYAASFGFTQIPSQYEEEYRNCLVDFQNYSVREQAGKKIIWDLLEKKASVDLDPTLLLTKNEWEILAGSQRQDIQNLVRNQNYVLVYMISENLQILTLANYIAKSYNATVVFINDRWKKRRGALNLKNVAVDEWLLLFKNAKFIVTNSFHGVAFSINLNKQFLVLQNKDMKKAVSRIDNILDMAGLSDRYVTDLQSGISRADTIIDYNVVNARMNEYRNESIEHLHELVKMEKDNNYDSKRKENS